MIEDELRAGIVRICDPDNRTRGTGFFVAPGCSTVFDASPVIGQSHEAATAERPKPWKCQGHLLTCHHVIGDLPAIMIRATDGALFSASFDSTASMPDLDLAVLHTNMELPRALPIEFAGKVGDRIWTSGFQMQSEAITNALPSRGSITGTTDVNYSSGGRTYRIADALRIEDLKTIGGGLSGAPAVLEEDGVVIGLINTRFKDIGGFILPLAGYKGDSPLLDILEGNRVRVPRFGRFLNWPGFLEVCKLQAQSKLKKLESSRKYVASRYVSRSAPESEIEKFLATKARIMPITGPTGTGKTFLMAHIARSLSQTRPTVVLLALEVSPNEEDLGGSVFQELKRSAPQLIPPAPFPFTSESLVGYKTPPVLLLDGLNEVEMPLRTIQRWVEASCEWLSSGNARLIVTLRPGLWDDIKSSFQPEMLYLVPASGEPEARKPVQVTDFTPDEVVRALVAYEVESQVAHVTIFRHPFFFWAYKGSNATTPDITTYDVYKSCFDQCVKRVREHVDVNRRVGTDFIHVKLDEIGRLLRREKSLWLQRGVFFELFSGERPVAEALLDELLVRGERGFRFAHDELAYFLVATTWTTDLQNAAGHVAEAQVSVLSNWRNLREEDPILWEATVWVVSALENQGKQNLLRRLLTALASTVHHGFWHDAPGKRYEEEEHDLFLRCVQYYLRDASPYYPVIETFAMNCAKSTDKIDENAHPLIPLHDLPGLTPYQRFQLLRPVAVREFDVWRWKDWDGTLGPVKNFWKEGVPEDRWDIVKTQTKKDIEESGDAVVDALFEWVDDPTELRTKSPPSEARLGDLACGLLFHLSSKWIDRIADGLAAKDRSGRADRLLDLMAERRHEDVTQVLERWIKERDPSRNWKILRLARRVLQSRPEPQIAERVGSALDLLVRRTRSRDGKASIVAVLSLVPSRADQTLDLAEKLNANRASPLSPEVFVELSKYSPERAFRQITQIVENSSERRWKAIEVLSHLSVTVKLALELLSTSIDWLAKYPEESSGLRQAIEHAVNEIAPDSDEERALVVRIAAIWTRYEPSVRMNIVDAVLSRAERTQLGLELLATVARLEDDQRNLQLLLKRVPAAKIAFENALHIVQDIAAKLSDRSGDENLLMAAASDSALAFAERLAELVSSDPEKWSPEMIEFKDAVNSGIDPVFAAREILWKAGRS